MGVFGLEELLAFCLLVFASNPLEAMNVFLISSSGKEKELEIPRTEFLARKVYQSIFPLSRSTSPFFFFFFSLSFEFQLSTYLE